MEALGVELAKTPDIIQQEEEKNRKVRERQQAKIIAQENFKRWMEQFKADIGLRFSLGYQLRQQFNLLNVPSVERIKEYQRTNNPNAFDGLKRKTGK